MRNAYLVLVTMSSLALLITGCHHQPVTAPAGPISVTPPPQATAPPLSPRSHAVIYVINPNATGDQDPLMPRTVTLRDPQSPAREAIIALIHARDTPIARRTALRGISIDNGLATLDFSQSPVNEIGGEGEQGQALTALSRTLGQFPEISQFQIEVKGQIVKAFGEFTTDGPMDVVRPEADQQAKGTAP